MTRFINTSLISLVAFFVFLAVLWLFVDPASPGLARTDTGPDNPVSLRSSDAEWGAADEAGTRLVVELSMRNDGPAAAITQVAARTTLDGQLVAMSTEDPPIVLPQGTTAPVRFTVLLPPDFASTWFGQYRERDESSTLRVDGTVTVRLASGDHRVPFEWDTSFKGDLLDRLAAGPQDCPGPPAPLCLAGLETRFDGGRLQTTLVLRNDQAEPVLVRNGTFRLAFEDVTVATGRLSGTLEIGAGDKAELPAHLVFDDGALAAWWAGHVGRCESSRLSFNVGLEVEGVDAGASQVDWDILAAPFQTAFLCNGGDS